MSKTLLVVDDEKAFSQTVQATFRQEIEQGLKIESAFSGSQAWKRIDAQPTTIKGVLIDLVVPDLKEGLTLIENLETKYPNIKYVVYSAQVSLKEYQEHFKRYKNMIACLDKGEISTKEVKKLIQEDFEIPQLDAAQQFSYDDLDSETSEFIQHQATKIRALLRQNILEIGSSLLEVKQRLKHGTFISWIESEFQWSYSLAYKFMRVADAFPNQFKSVNFTDLNLAPSALYLLAAVSVPEAAREEAIARAQAGEEITYSIAQEIKRKHTSKTRSVLSEAQETQDSESTLELPAVSSLEADRLDTGISSPSELEVVALRPLSKASPPSSPDPAPWWQLGSHYLCCGDPTSHQFQERLPNEIALSLAFPPDRNWFLANPLPTNSSLALYRGYEDEDLILFREMIQRALELYTEASNVVVFSYLPDPDLLKLADALGCCCYIADPDLQRCQAAIAAWQEQGGTVQQIDA